MHLADTRDKFIELRAQGWSLGHIANELHVSKRTLVDWNRECAAAIQSCRAVEMEAVQEKILASREEELTRLVRLQKDVEDELASRTLKFVPIDKLFRFAAQLRQEIKQARLNNDEEPSSSPAADSQLGAAGNGPDTSLLTPAKTTK